MKRFFLFLSIICLLALPGCGKQAEPIVLPEPENITEILIKDGETAKAYSDSGDIQEILSGLAGSKPTNRQSIQDAPLNKNALQLEFQFRPDAPVQSGVSTVFVYEEHGKCYVEQPYQGIYSIPRELYDKIIEVK